MSALDRLSRAEAKLSGNARGAVWMLASAVCFTAMAVLLKLLANRGYSESQMVFFRCAAGFAAILPFALTAGRKAIAINRPWPLFLRSAYSTLGFFAGFYAVARLPLADAQAISFSRALFVTLLAIWILKEPVGWRRWSAVGVGFIGVLVMLRPSGESAVSLAAMMGVASAFLFALAIVTVKDLTRDHSTLTLVIVTNAFTTVAGLPFAFAAWTQPGLWDALALIALGVTGVAAQSCYVRALGTGEASLMGLIDYARMPLAALAGFLVFAERPDGYGLLGAGIVIASTLYITWRESKLGRAKPKEPV